MNSACRSDDSYFAFVLNSRKGRQYDGNSARQFTRMEGQEKLARNVEFDLIVRTEVRPSGQMDFKSSLALSQRPIEHKFAGHT